MVLIAFLAKNVPCAKKISSSLIPSQRLRQINDCATRLRDTTVWPILFSPNG